VEGIRSAGSDTTLFVMQKIGDLYTGAGLYGCTLNSSAGQPLYNSSDPASATTNEEYYCADASGGGTANISTTDVNDNWDRTEVTEGVDDIGSSPGQSQLCAALSTPLPVDFARSAKPAGTACATLGAAGYAKDGIPIMDYPVNPNLYGTSSTAPIRPSTVAWWVRCQRAGCRATRTGGPTPVPPSSAFPTPMVAGSGEHGVSAVVRL